MVAARITVQTAQVSSVAPRKAALAAVSIPTDGQRLHDQEENKQCLQRIYLEVATGHDLSLVDKVFAEAVVDHEGFGGGSGPADLRACLDALFETFPDSIG